MLKGSTFVHNNCPEMYLGGGVMNFCLSCCLPFLMSTIIGRTCCHVHLCSLSRSQTYSHM